MPQAVAWCALAVALGAQVAHAQSKTFARQRKYVTTHEFPPTAEIPLAPEAMPQPDAAPALAEPRPPPAPSPVPPASVAPAPAPLGPALAPRPPIYPPAYPTWFAAPQPGPPPGYFAAPPRVPAPAALPPAGPPRGYVLVPVPPHPAPQEDARRAWLAAQLAQVDQQLAQLQRERKSIVRPIVQLALGYAGALACSSVALSSFTAAEDIEHHDLDATGDGRVHRHDEDALRNTGYAFTGLAAVGLAIGVSGTVRLVRNAAANRSVKAERRNLLAQRSSLRQQLSYAAGVSPGQLRFGVQGRF